MRGYLFGLILAGISIVACANAQSFLGFRLLDLDGNLVKWSGGGDKSVVVTYALVDRPLEFPNTRNCESMLPNDGLLRASRITLAEFRNEVRHAFDMWEKVANIEFREIDAPDAAGILIGTQLYPHGRAFADVSYRAGNGPVREIDRSLICLNPNKPWKIRFDGNLAIYDLRYTIAHEIGHAIGLDHPESSGLLMSHRYQEDFRTLRDGDVSGAVHLYGAKQK